MVKKYFFSILLLLPFSGNSQNNGCIDSVSLNQFYPSTFNTPISSVGDFYFTPQRDVLDNLYTSGRSGSGGFNNSYWSIIKFDVNNKLVWYKNYKEDIFLTFRGGGNIYDIEPNGNLVFADNITNLVNSGSFWNLITKTDSAGNFLWSRTIKHGIDPYVTGGLSFPKTNDNGELFALGRYFDNREEPLVVALDAAGNLKWSKRYKHITVPKFHLRGSSFTIENNNSIAVAIQYYYDADIITDPAAKHGFQLFKINTNDGSITSQVSFMYFNDVAGNNLNSAELQKLNYDPVTKRFLLCAAGGSGGGNCVLSLFDENLNHVKTKLFSTSSLISPSKRTIGKHNQICLIRDYQGPVHSFHYTTIDNELNLVSQRFINLDALGFPNRNFGVDLSYKKNGMLSFQVGTYSSVGSPPQYFYIQDQSPFYNNISTCVGKDSLVYSVLPIYTNIVANPLIEEAGNTPLAITNNFPDFPPVDFPLPKTLICKEVSICDTIKLLGTKYHCMSSPLDSFKIYRNPLCLRKTNWQVDTNYIKILSQNDTALYVEYKQSYRGKIKVSFGGCSLSDSIDIEVYNAQTGINLGNDTMHCPGKTITLRAGKNYKTYKWQDGSSKDSLVAAQPGMYNVIATDSCGNIFKDTLQINPFDVVLKTDYPKLLCPGDTVSFILPNQLINYSWLPATNSTLTGLTWRLFPPFTTTYSISGQRLPGCTVSDTVLINVKPNCLPDYMYFPTAFTPDNNGVNDTYKPGFNGQLALYQFIIYNRYGQPVFITTDPTKGWDGRFKNSKPLTGSYVWMCKYQFVGRPVQQEQGTFTLIR
jgi:gliding motility-associated-like protein